MPHVSVRLYPGRTEAQKQKLADAITQALIAEAGSAEKSISVCIEDVAAADWKDSVYTPDILGNWDRLYKKPGYQPD